MTSKYDNMDMEKVERLKDLLVNEYRVHGKVINPLNHDHPIIDKIECTWDELFCAMNGAKIEFELDSVHCIDDDTQILDLNQLGVK